MIDSAFASALERIESRNADVRDAYQPGAFPSRDDVARAQPLQRVADPLSVTLPEGAFTLSPGSDGRLVFSRDGTFHLEGGVLLSDGGKPVLGFRMGDRTKLEPLRVDRYDRALGAVANVRIDADGTLAYSRSGIDPRTGRRRVERVAIGRIALARFPAGTSPVRLDVTHVRPPDGVTPRLGVPADGSFGALAIKSRDSGRIDMMQGLAKMQEAYIQLEALQAAQKTNDQTDKTAMDLLK